VNVLQVVDSLRLGGAERTAVDLVNLLDPDAMTVSLCATRDGGPLAAELRDGVAPVVLGRRHRWDPAGVAAFARLVRQREIDVVHSHGRGSAQFVSLCRRVAGLPVRHVFTDHFSAGCGGGAEVSTRLAMRIGGVDAYIGVHRPLRDWAITPGGLAPGRVHLIPNGIDLRRFPGPSPATSGRRPLTVAMVAAFRPVKDHPTLLRALAATCHRADVRLVVVGGTAPGDAGYADRCRSMIAELHLDGQVSLLGSRSDVTEVLATADIGVLSSSSESGPLALLEYMASGLPFVVTDTGELASAVKGSDAGVVVPRGDPEALAAALDRIVELPDDDRLAMGARGRALVAERFDQTQTAARVAEVYRSLGAPRRLRAARRKPC